MSRQAAFAGVGIAVIAGVLTSYSTFQPELQRIKDEREGVFHEQHPTLQHETTISDAMKSDFKEAGEEVRRARWGAGWRKLLFGEKEQGGTRATGAAGAASAPGDGKGKSGG